MLGVSDRILGEYEDIGAIPLRRPIRDRVWHIYSDLLGWDHSSDPEATLGYLKN
jgi:hypothetical protein